MSWLLFSVLLPAVVGFIVGMIVWSRTFTAQSSSRKHANDFIEIDEHDIP